MTAQYQTLPSDHKTVSYPRLVLRIVLLTLATVVATLGTVAANVYDYDLIFRTAYEVQHGVKWPATATILRLPIADDECDEAIILVLLAAVFVGSAFLGLVSLMQVLTLCCTVLTSRGCFGSCMTCMLGFAVMMLVVGDVLILVQFKSAMCAYTSKDGSPQAMADLDTNLGPAVALFPLACVLAVVAACVNPVVTKPTPPPAAPAIL